MFNPKTYLLVRHSPRLWLACLVGVAFLSGPQGSAVDFSSEIRPILSDKCFQCHGPDKDHRKAGFRLDTKEGAMADLGGYKAVVPGDPEKSEIWKRITATDPEDVMPPLKSSKSLDDSEKEKIRQWILQGANWEEHWAFKPVARPELPDVKFDEWVRNPVDHFVLARLEREGLNPAPAATREKLLRRVYLTLTGLPPNPEELDAFLEDTSEDAYERQVDRLLESAAYGEHMARYWLDGARYGDTHGLHLDNERSIWPYRDWVVQAFNDNLPFDDFTVDQIAGDLLPEPRRDQLVATGFNRCNVSTSEGGAIPEEFAVRYAIDRVSTLSTVWMGLTAGCAQCHDHKFDPLSQKEFYSLYAFYNNLDENPMDGNAFLYPPTLRLDSPQDKAVLESKEDQIEKVEKAIRLNLVAAQYRDPLKNEEIENLLATDRIWVDDALPQGVKTGEGPWPFVYDYEAPIFSGKTSHMGVAQGKAQHLFESATYPLRIGKNDTLFTHVYLDPSNPPQSIMVQFKSGNNWNHRAYWGEDLIDYGSGDGEGHRPMGALPATGQWVRLELDAAHVGLKPGMLVDGMAFSQFDGRVYWDASGIRSRWPQGEEGFASVRAWFHYMHEQENPSLPGHLKDLLKNPFASLNGAQQQLFRDHFIEFEWNEMRDVFDPLHARLDAIRKEKSAYENSIPKTLVTRELAEPRETFVLVRGEYDNKGEPVKAGVPAFLPPLPKDQPVNRLALARWLIDPTHPLTSRVAVNRFWQQHFGTGIVATSEDFGAQGETPSHPGLLDWLAAEFMGSGWDTKHIQKLIVMSATYRQSSDITPDLRKRDPGNRLLARGPKFRLDAEVLRDQSLSLSGLLVEEIGGRGVRPYQPEGLWKAVAYPSSTTARYVQDQDRALFRRSLYTFWKRTSPPPAMTTFDAPTREACTVRRERTNTPLQALVLMNDVQFAEAARHMALRILRKGPSALEEKIEYAFRLATGREPDERERDILRDNYKQHEAFFDADPKAATDLVEYGDSAVFPGVAHRELATWTMIASLLMNLDEAITLN